MTRWRKLRQLSSVWAIKILTQDYNPVTGKWFKSSFCVTEDYYSVRYFIKLFSVITEKNRNIKELSREGAVSHDSIVNQHEGLEEGEARFNCTKQITNTPYSFNPLVFQSYMWYEWFFSNLSWTIAKICMEVVTIRSLILPNVWCIFKKTIRTSFLHSIWTRPINFLLNYLN